MVGEKAKGAEEKERKSKEEKRWEGRLITKVQKQRNKRGNKEDRKREEVRIEWKRGEGEEGRKNCDTLWWKYIIKRLQ